MTSSWLWTSLCLLVAFVVNSAAHAPQSPQRAGRFAYKVPALLKAEYLSADLKDDELRKLLKARYNEALAEAKTHLESERLGVDRLVLQDDVYGRWQRLVQ